MHSDIAMLEVSLYNDRKDMTAMFSGHGNKESAIDIETRQVNPDVSEFKRHGATPTPCVH